MNFFLGGGFIFTKGDEKPWVKDEGERCVHNVTHPRIEWRKTDKHRNSQCCSTPHFSQWWTTSSSTAEQLKWQLKELDQQIQADQYSEEKKIAMQICKIQAWMMCLQWRYALQRMVAACLRLKFDDSRRVHTNKQSPQERVVRAELRKCIKNANQGQRNVRYWPRADRKEF